MNWDGRLEPSIEFDLYTAGPLQGKVNSPDLTDWQNIDWSALTSSATDTMVLPAGLMNFTSEETSGLFESGNGFVSALCTVLHDNTQVLLMVTNDWRSRSSLITACSIHDKLTNDKEVAVCSTCHVSLGNHHISELEKP